MAEMALTPSTPALLDVDSWCRQGMVLVYSGLRLKGIVDDWRFQTGDWFNQGEEMLGEDAYGYTRGFGDEALRQYAWVAAKVVTRVPELPWAHHREVAALPPAEQEERLRQAQDEGLSTRELHRVIHGEPEEKERCVCPSCGHSHQRRT